MNSGKYAKYKVLLEEDRLHPYLPETAMLTETNFWRLMNKYGDLILKPTAGGGGAGILRVRRDENQAYLIHSGTQSKRVTGEENAFRCIQKKIGKQYYVVQQRINLAKYKGRILDVRVMVQRRRGGPWDVTGRLAKVAGDGFVITNTARSHGYVIEFERVGDHLLKQELNQMAILTASTLSKTYEGIQTVGLDVAIDNKGRIWILECNFRPASSLFRKLKDKSMYKRILSYYKKASA